MNFLNNCKTLARSASAASLLLPALAWSNTTESATSTNDAGHHKDYRTFYKDKVECGKFCDSFDADLVMYVAGNQFMVIEDLMNDFQSRHSDIEKIFVITMPPGQILNDLILNSGELYGQQVNQFPDIYASVDPSHLQTLQQAERIDDWQTYMHNKLELMVANGNPKNIKHVYDLGRYDLTHSHPNAVNEGIFAVHGRNMLRQLELDEQLGADTMVIGDWGVEDKVWYTTRHHRETPHRIINGLADVGIVWSSEVVEAINDGLDVEGVAIHAPYHQQASVNYEITALKDGNNQKAAQIFMDYILSAPAQDIYVSHGFVATC